MHQQYGESVKNLEVLKFFLKVTVYKECIPRGVPKKRILSNCVKLGEGGGVDMSKININSTMGWTGIKSI